MATHPDTAPAREDVQQVHWSFTVLLMCGGGLKDAIITQWDFKRSNSRTHSNRVRTSHHISSSVPRPVMQIWRQHIFQLKRWITRVITFLENLRCEYATGWSWASCSRHYTAQCAVCWLRCPCIQKCPVSYTEASVMEPYHIQLNFYISVSNTEQ